MEDQDAGMVGDVPMRRILVRLGDDVYDRIKQVAEREGVSMSQYLREAALARVWFTVGVAHGDDADVGRVLLALARAADGEGVDLDEYLGRLLRSRP